MPRKTARLELTLLLAVAGLLGCGRRHDQVEGARRCVDADGGPAEDRLCEEAERGATASWGGDGGAQDGAVAVHRTFGGGYHFLYWGGGGWYARPPMAGFRGAPGPGPGGAAGEGSAAGVSRGGFGGTGAAHASGGASAPASSGHGGSAGGGHAAAGS